MLVYHVFSPGMVTAHRTVLSKIGIANAGTAWARPHPPHRSQECGGLLSWELEPVMLKEHYITSCNASGALNTCAKCAPSFEGNASKSSVQVASGEALPDLPNSRGDRGQVRG